MFEVNFYLLQLFPLSNANGAKFSRAKFTFMKSRSEDLGTGAFLFTIFILTGEIFILSGTLSLGQHYGF